MNSTQAPGPRWSAITSAVGIAVLTGLFGMPIAFFIAYAFRDVVTPAEHGLFLLGVLVLTLVSTLIAWPVLAAAFRYGAARGLVGALAVVGASYAAALGLGTVVTLLNEPAGSVTADQPDSPFLALVASCIVAVAVGWVVAGRVLRTGLHSEPFSGLPGQESNLRR